MQCAACRQLFVAPAVGEGPAAGDEDSHCPLCRGHLSSFDIAGFGLGLGLSNFELCLQGAFPAPPSWDGQGGADLCSQGALSHPSTWQGGAGGQ